MTNGRCVNLELSRFVPCCVLFVALFEMRKQDIAYYSFTSISVFI